MKSTPLRMRRTAVTLAASACLAAACSASSSDGGQTQSAVTATTIPASLPLEQEVQKGAEEEAPTTSTPPPSSSPASSSTTTVTTTQPVTTSSPTSSPTTVEAAATSCVSELTVRERVALLVWPAVYAEDWPGAVATVRDNDVGGVLLMSQDGLDASTVTARLTELEAASRHGLIISTDEEGGDVQRLRSIEQLSSQREVARDLTPDDATTLIADHGELVRELGVDMVLGPVVDVEPNVGDVPLQSSRFFAGPPQLVSDYGAAYLTGWTQAGLFATIKHYPGHGAASGDTHIADGVTPSLSDLETFDLLPYRDLRDLAVSTNTAVMIGHLTVPGLTDGVPATRSPAAISYLRDEFGF